LNSFENQRWWKKGLFFECFGCGRCCRGEPGAIWFTPEEGEAIADYLGLSREAFFASSVISLEGRPSIRERRNGECIFLDPEKQRCQIYPVRPAQCALFPFWPSVLASPERWAIHARKCPGMNRGRLYQEEEILALLRKSPFRDL
jgi:Fe-S-cluster containining protein